MQNRYQVIHIHQQAPTKPPMDKTCNGCGVCCAAEPCPVSLVLLWPHQSPCKALVWHHESKRYLCGMVSKPSHYLKFLPATFNHLASRLFKRWIAADTACDVSIENETS